MERWLGKTAIVTGAAGGFGKAVSELLVKNGLKVNHNYLLPFPVYS